MIYDDVCRDLRFDPLRERLAAILSVGWGRARRRAEFPRERLAQDATGSVYDVNSESSAAIRNATSDRGALRPDS